MLALLHLAWAHLVHERRRSLLVTGALALTLLLPVAIQVLFARYRTGLLERADHTPLVVGAPGSRYDLVLKSLYFRGRTPAPLPYAELARARDDRLGAVVPLYVNGSAREHPILGTELEYFDLRGLALAAGTPFTRVGECVLGADVAGNLGLGPGDHLLTDQENLYDLTKGYPLKLRVAGVLDPAGTPDDGAVLVDLRTAWILAGIGHGHQDAEAQDESAVLDRDGGAVTLGASVFEYQEITEANADSFHFHGDPGDRPLTSLLVFPSDARSSTVLKGRYRVRPGTQLLVPTKVVEELLGFVLRWKRLLDANGLFVAGAAALFLAVIVSLSVQARRGELMTLTRLGCGRGRIAALFALEVLLLVLSGAVCAGVSGFALADLVARLVLGA